MRILTATPPVNPSDPGFFYPVPPTPVPCPRSIYRRKKNNGAATPYLSVTPVFCAAPVHPASVNVSRSVRVLRLRTGLGNVR